jgi:hypothetical protein
MSEIDEHLELHFGHPERVVDVAHVGVIRAVWIYRSVPASGMVTLVTLGLSDKPLAQKQKGKIRQELMFVLREEDEELLPNIVALLGVISEEIGSRGAALSRGEVLGPAGPIVPSSALVSVVALLPPFIPKAAQAVKTTSGLLMLVWLVPLTAEESEVARNEGPDRLEDLLVSAQERVNLYDPSRRTFLAS